MYWLARGSSRRSVGTSTRRIPTVPAVGPSCAPATPTAGAEIAPAVKAVSTRRACATRAVRTAPFLERRVRDGARVHPGDGRRQDGDGELRIPLDLVGAERDGCDDRRGGGERGGGDGQ